MVEIYSCHYLVCNNESTLLWLINLGCIDINPWNSTTQTPDQPDYIAIDLDPSDKDEKNIDLKKLLNTAVAAKEYFDSLNMKAFCKTSGKTGIHFFIPCNNITSNQARSIAEHICASIHELVPDDSTISNSISSRKGKVYIDPLQNDYADTLASCYSVRPYHVPAVSTPMEWKEINFKLKPAEFTLQEVLKRLSKKGDLFKGVLDKKVVEHNIKIINRDKG
jgi:bifunctional non-homologous end joining protein LigD